MSAGYWFCSATTNPCGYTNYMSAVFCGESPYTQAFQNEYYAYVRAN